MPGRKPAPTAAMLPAAAAAVLPAAATAATAADQGAMKPKALSCT